ncbi:glycosyltransferase family 2 protein [Pyrococcus horikoshii]|uniref:Glycosyltransferase family 2 protein n=1 Tax=Pyrococcus horikoshii TaxID=53953 RepID=A0A832T1M6_PYRHR|nr:glycosyltransferase family 2 protein [Pyrococcus horikoshii]HII60985.1 glycosyltransferase family 2 protein [Pyrococcus horikoshii]
MEKGLVSVVLPTYNRAKVLPRAIESVLNQTYTNIELIIVDDGSRDNTKEIIREFQSQDERIVYLRNKRNLGANAARNIGIMHSTGEFIAFMDSDDMWLPWKLERQIKIMYSSLNSYPIVYSGFIRIYKTDKNKVILSYYPKNPLQFQQIVPQYISIS